MNAMRCAGLLAMTVFSTLAWSGARDATLVTAIRSADPAAVRAALKGANPNQLLADGSTPLSWAVETQDPAIVRLLLDARAKPDAARNAAAAPLLLACEFGNADIVLQLVAAGAQVGRRGPDGVAPLALCAGNATTETVTRLLERGAPVDAADETGQTALMWAAARGRLESARMLIAAGADVNRVTQDGFTPLFFALKSGRAELPVAILEAGADADHVGPDGTTAAQLAIFQGDYAFAARMIERGVDVRALDRNGHTLLIAAVVANQPALVRLLLARGANPDTWTGPSKVEWRYEPNFRNGKYDAPSKPPLLLAAEKGAVDVMEVLVAGGADPNVAMPDGTTVVHAAVMSERVAAVAAALRIRPDANVKTAVGRTPLHQLLRQRHYPGNEAVEILRLLAAKGARADLKDNRGLLATDMADGERLGPLKAEFESVFGARTTALR